MKVQFSKPKTPASRSREAIATSDAAFSPDLYAWRDARGSWLSLVMEPVESLKPSLHFEANQAAASHRLP
jgi:hypothetical protein